MGRRVYIRSSKANKHSYIGNNTHTTEGELKETTSIRVRFGNWGRVLRDFISKYGSKLIKPIFLVNHVLENGLARGEDKPRLRRRAYDVFKRFVKHGILTRVGRGWYRVVVDPVDMDVIYMNVSTPLLKLSKGNSNPDSKPRSSKGNSNLAPNPSSKPNVELKEIDGTSPPGFSGCVSSVFLDNVRGVRVDGFVHGDRGRVVCFGDLSRFSHVSYAEVSIPSYTRFFDGLGVVVVYFGGKFVECLSNPACHGVRVESDWFEWRAPSGFYGSHSILDARRVFRERVIPYALAIVLRVARSSGVSLARLAQVVWAFHRELYYFIKRRSFTKTPSDRVVMDCIDKCIEGYLASFSGLPPPG